DVRQIIEKDGKKYIRFVPLREKVNNALDIFDIICRWKNGEEEGVSVFERNYLQEAMEAIFQKLGLTSHPDSLFEDKVVQVDNQIIQSRVRKPEPTISDVFNYLTEHYRNEQRAHRLIAAIRPFLRSGSKPIFDGQTYLGKGVTESL